MGQKLTCAELERLLYHFQADELDEADRESVVDHLDVCQACARLSRVEDALLGAVKARLTRVPAPAGLDDRLRAALDRETGPSSLGGRSRGGWLMPVAASVLLALALLPIASRVRGAGGDVIRIDDQVTVVDYDCDRAGLAVRQQRRCTKRHHLNALKLGPDRYWAVSVDTPDGRAMVVDDDLRGHRLRVRGVLYTDIRTVRIEEYTDLGLGDEIAARMLR